MTDERFNKIGQLLDEDGCWAIAQAQESIRALLEMAPRKNYGLQRQLEDVEYFLHRASQELQAIEAYDFEVETEDDSDD